MVVWGEGGRSAGESDFERSIGASASEMAAIARNHPKARVESGGPVRILGWGGSSSVLCGAREDQIFFASGSSEVAGSDRLEKTLRWIQDGFLQQKSAGCNWNAALVRGYTDTVGSADANRKYPLNVQPVSLVFSGNEGFEFKFCIRDSGKRLWRSKRAIM